MEVAAATTSLKSASDQEIVSMEVDENDVISEIPNSHGTKEEWEYLQTLGLSEYFPEKITLQTAIEKSSNKLDSLKDLPWYFLTKIMMLDYRGRDDMASQISGEQFESESELNINNGSENECESIILELEKCFASPDSSSSAPHPLDVLTAVLNCCSNFLRQIMFEKMFMCKLSVPLFLPPFLGKEYMFMLWALRNIALEFRKVNGELCKGSIANHPIPVVSCLRFGEISRSKSNFLNEMLNGQSHPTFYHRDCEGGMRERILSEGLIEMAWSLRSKNVINQKEQGESVARDKYPFQSSDVAFLNLRGNGKSQESSVKFIAHISDVVLVILDVCELDDKNVMDSLKEIASNNVQLIVMLSKQPNSKPPTNIRDIIMKLVGEIKYGNFGKDNILCDFNVKGSMNIKDLKKQTEVKITKCLEKMFSKRAPKTFEERIKSVEVSIDEVTPECMLGKERASLVIEKIGEENKGILRNVKLPLQCKPWQEWSKLDKEGRRRGKIGNQDTSSYMDKIHEDKKQQRREQVQILQSPNKFFSEFVHHLLKSKGEERLYYLKWLKLYLDENSKEILPGLQHKFSEKWNEIRQCEEDSKTLNHLKKELAQFEEELSESSFGLEHLFRELSQAYEAVQDQTETVSKRIYDEISCLPKAMAELLLLGYPLELMDGDAASVPLTWIKSVLEQLRMLIGDKKIFVLSVLGIQSSGKSTLLNTMFGLQFAVAAGRCTRGVYAQLVPLPNEYANDKYEYILVVDTEGLRAVELGTEKHHHDNEIATLVVGLGDVTLVNIKGENVAELEDVLQIVVHALLKMKLVNKSLALQPSCFFIHQNVPAPDAAQKLRSGQQKFIETLDMVTNAAGKQEDEPQYTKFSQVIDFDISTNISYFSDLWKGDPPMGAANPGYSENVKRVKEILLTDIMNKRTTYLSLQKFGIKLKDLWNGILDQNFVFSFKNNLEMEAYSSLEARFADILWTMKKTARKWQNDKENEIMSSESGFDDLKSSLTSECCHNMQELYEKAKDKLNVVFENDEDCSTLEQWRSRTYKKLDNCKEEIIESTTRALNDKLKVMKIQSDQKEDMEKYKADVIQGAKKVAETLRSEQNHQVLKEEELETCFMEKWNEMIKDLPENRDSNINIEDRVINVLYREFHEDFAVLKKGLEDLQIEEECVIHSNIKHAFEKYVSEGRVVLGMKLPNYHFLNKKVSGNEFVNEVCKEVKSFVVNKKEFGLNPQNRKSLVAMAKDKVRKVKDSGLCISNEEEFEIAIAICICQCASYEYSKSYKEEVDNNGRFQMGKYGIHPFLEEALRSEYNSKLMPVFHKSQKKKLKISIINIEHHVTSGLGAEDVEACVAVIVNKLSEDVELYVSKSEIQDFRDDYVEDIVRMVWDSASVSKFINLKKEAKISLAIHACYSALPKFIEKHAMFVNNLNPRVVLERDYYRTYLQMFKNSYNKITGEAALAMVLSERLSSAIENAVSKEMAADLADDVRNNVSEVTLKPALLKAILMKLLEEDRFEEFMLYLDDTKACYEKWIAYFIDNYLFHRKERGIHRYSEIASCNIKSLMSKIYDDISRPMPTISKDTDDKGAFHQWIKEFQNRVSGKLAITQQDLLSLTDGQDILSIGSFGEYFENSLRPSEKKLQSVFQEHTKDNLRLQPDNVYDLIGRECRGCTEKCPFCSAPCRLNMAGHIDQSEGVKHWAYEHYPQACGRCHWEQTGKLVIENCSALIASDNRFKNDKTEMVFHPYKTYQRFYPDWKIDGDPSVDASPYWKWFLVKYESQLAERYKVQRPDLPNSWKDITKEMAKESLDTK